MKKYMEKKPNEKEVLRKIKEVILSTAKKHGIEVDKIILFGSRARGDYTKESDWDILVITKNKIDEKEKWDFWEKIMLSLSKYNIGIFIISSKEYEKYRDIPGTIERYSYIEGVIEKQHQNKKMR